VVEVADDGPGIEAEVLPRVFEPFYTTKPGHRGLGLAWVYGVVTNHGGSVVLQSAPKKGTSVRICLPATQTKSRQLAPKATLGGRGETVLFVDDEELLLNLARTVLYASGYKVLVANSAQRALEILQAGSPRVDLLITDLVMPQMTGRQLVDRARALNSKLRVVLSSGYHRASEDPAGVRFLQKPFSSQDLLQEVKQALDSAGAG
jgi:CheY-like chemotaxis protein